MTTQPPKIHDPVFLKTALKLGFTKQDLQPVSLSKIQHNSHHTTQAMSQLEKEYYINKKYQAIKERQNKIYSQVIKEIENQNKIKYERRDFNPAIKKLLEDH